MHERKFRIKEDHEEAVTTKTGKHQEEVDLGGKRKRGGGNQQKTSCTLSHQGECFAAVAQRFARAPSLPSFRALRGECRASAMKTAAGESEISTPTAPNLKIRVSAECSALMKDTKSGTGKFRRGVP